MADRQSDDASDDFSTRGLPPQSPLHFGELETKFHTRQELKEGDRFVVKRKYAKGGLGEILIAEDQELNREVALKRIQDWHADNPESQSRFFLEAEITGGLEHPGIVPVYGLGTDQAGHPYYAMRLVRGESLNAAIQKFHGTHEKPFETSNSVEFRRLLSRFIDVCDAVEYAHSRGIIHRDIKPANVILGPYGETLLVDWGLAKVIGKSTTNPSVNDEPTLRPTSGSAQLRTSAGSRVGTPGYMSPEQSMGRGELVDGRSDVFSLGATLYTMLAGEPSINRKGRLGEAD